MITYRIPDFCIGYETVTGSELARIVAREKPVYIIVDTETYFNPLNTKAIIRFIQDSPNNEPFGFSFRFNGKCYWVLEEFDCLSSVFSNDSITFVNQNMKYDFHMMANIDLPIPTNWEDTIIMIQVLDSELKCIRPDGNLKKTKALKNMAYHFLERRGKLRGKISLGLPQLKDTQILEEFVDQARADIAKTRGVHKEDVSYKDVNDLYPELMKYYACVDTHLVDILWQPFLRVIKEEQQYNAYRQDVDATMWLLNMERRGIRVDRLKMQRDEHILDNVLEELVPHIQRLAGCTFNINSAVDLSNMYKDRFGIVWEWFTEKGTVDTKKATLEALAKLYPDTEELTQLILTYRSATHIRDTYITGLYPLIQNGRIHAELLLAPMDDSSGATITGRLSSKNPNIQNIPKRPVKINYLDKEIVIRPREYYIPDEGCVFIRCDGDQQEYRALGHYSNDKKFMQIIHEGKDIHKGTASTIFKVLYEEVTKEQRDVGKTTNFA